MSINIYVYWGPRKKSPDQLVPQLQAHFRALAETGESLAQWAPLGGSLKKAMASEPVDTMSLEALHRRLLKGQNWTDMPPRQPIAELGFRVWLWNQRRGNTEASTSVHCGSYSEYLSEDSQNNASLELSYMAGGKALDAKVLLGLFLKFIDVWEPGWGSVWRYVHEGSPAGAPWDPTHIQYAFYQAQSGTTPDGHGIGRQQIMQNGGRLWVDETVSPFLDNRQAGPA